MVEAGIEQQVCLGLYRFHEAVVNLPMSNRAKKQYYSSWGFIGMSTNTTHQEGKQRKISSDEKEVMRDLLRIGAATATKFEVRTDRIGDDVEKVLNELHSLHLIGKKSESNVYYPTFRTLWESYV